MEDNNQKLNIIIPFYLGEKENISHLKITDIWRWDFAKLECTHDYIQWLFPLNEASFYNPDAPILDSESINYFRKNQILRDNLKRSLLIMLRFYGLTFNRSEGKIFIDKGDNYLARKS
ncbi:opioid growth factor receptor [Geminocystis sp. NIES-3709]|nr:opioid growth factor receptor [Geminocystis sp. NIES-3709]